MEIVLFIFMLFCHIVDDYYLQGVLAQMKQRSWWKENCPNKLYRYDYLVALVEHAFSWSFMIMLPLFVYMYWTENFIALFYYLALIINMVVHAFVDHLKANRKVINLLDDQMLHIAQVAITWAVFVLID